MNGEKILKNLKIAHPTAGCELEYSTPFELLVAVILSAQCTDKRVNIATRELFKVYNTPEQFASLTLDELKPYIFSCGFYNNKGTNIINMSRALMEKHGGVVPKTLEELTALAGVGRKTASVVLSVAYDIPAMPVDTHVFRVSRRIGLASGDTVEKVERELMASFKESDWNSLHHTLIFQGRYVCKSQKPDCENCMIKEECKYYKEK
ncbi:MAG: endonuclease III [Clostridia bacterium]|nr:endonuclease III [Clostridia bacterium]